MSGWITDTITLFGYLGIFLLMLVESIFPPIPSELIIPFAGFSAAAGNLNVVAVILAATAGSLVGAAPWYIVARLIGLERIRWLADRYGRWFTLNAAEIDTASAWFVRWGRIIVMAGRLLPIIRTLISVPAGLAKMPVGLFVAFSALGMLLWNTVLVTAGYLLHEHYHLVEKWIDPLTYVVLIGVVALYLFRLVTWKPSANT